MKKKILLVLIVAFFMLWGVWRVLSIEDYNNFKIEQNIISYNLNEPDREISLPKKLREISGISYYMNNLLICIQDEKGVIYFFDTMQEKIVRKTKFSKRGDYEDITFFENNAYIIRSDGRLYKVENFDTENPKISWLDTELDEDNNTEGLCYHTKTNSLLIACKELSNLPEQEEEPMKRAIYRFSLKFEELIEEPFIKLDLYENFKDIKPSAIAIHPITEEIYILASVGKSLIICSPDRRINQIVKLEKRIFKQPEGICFSPEGDLYISNEGKKGSANILIFKY